jgi:hypothetical protein
MLRGHPNLGTGRSCNDAAVKLPVATNENMEQTENTHCADFPNELTELETF